MTAIYILVSVAAALVLIPSVILVLEVIGALGQEPCRTPGCTSPCSTAVLIPAHDEAAGIARSLGSIACQLGARDRIVVVADNCTDATASVAAANGAEVITRRDPLRRGKGFALDFGIRYLERMPPEVVVVVDADCEMSAGSLTLLVSECRRLNRPVQALYLMLTAPGAGVRMRIARFAWVLKNHVRPLGLRSLGLPCQLTGSGMAFPWICIRDAQLASGHIVEDMRLGVELARAGKAPYFCAEALITSCFPTSDDGVQTQRTRWEHGHLAVILHDVVPLLRDGLLRTDWSITAMALDLSVPPLAFLALSQFATLIVCAAFFFVTTLRLPLALAGVGVGLLMVSVTLSWLRHGRDVVSLVDLVLAPVYALRKLPLYFRFLASRQAEWVRSRRDGQ